MATHDYPAPAGGAKPIEAAAITSKIGAVLTIAWVFLLVERLGTELEWGNRVLWNASGLVGVLLIGGAGLYLFRHVRIVPAVRGLLVFALALLVLWGAFAVVESLPAWERLDAITWIGPIKVILTSATLTGSGVLMLFGFFTALVQAEVQREALIREQELVAQAAQERRQTHEELQESEIRYRALVELSPVAIVVEVEGRMVYMNTAVLTLLGMEDRDELIGRSIVEFIHPESRAAGEDYIQSIAAQGGRAEAIEAKFLRPDGEDVITEMGGACVVYEGKIGVQLSIQDITQRKHLEEELRLLSQRDGLTGIANRRAFDEFLRREMRRTHRNKQPLSLILIDIDAFKPYNDNYGHQAGDDCLKRVASAFAGVLKRPADLVARYGGEEFAVVLPDTDTEGAVLVAEQLRAAVGALKLEHAYSPVGDLLSISAGVATVAGDAEMKPRDIVKAADEALYRAKDGGRDQVAR